MTPVLDHIGFQCSDFPASRAFFVAALAPLGIDVVRSGDGWAMLGRDGRPHFWLGGLGPAPGPIHVAFAARSRAEVDAFHVAALAAGGTDHGGPGLRDYAPGYYAAFVLGPDGHNIEAVFHDPSVAASDER